MTLSPAEQQVFNLIGDGLSAKEIAEKLGKSPRTVEAQKQTIRLKLGLKDWRQLLIAAVKAKGGLA